MNLKEILDKLNKIKMFNTAFNLSDHIENAFKKLEIEGEIAPKNINKIVIVGMGGSGIIGNILSDWLEMKIKIPIFLWKDYNLPSWIDSNTLILAISYSGNTEEVLSSIIYAIKRKCQIVGITSNGMLLQLASKYNFPIIKIPQGYQPREAIPYLLSGGIIALCETNIIKREKVNEEVDEVLKTLNEMKIELKKDFNKIIQLARNLCKSHIVIYTYKPLRAAALRFKQQLNENSKCFAKVEFLPEAGHNEIVGWKADDKVLTNIKVVFLRDLIENEVMSARIKAFIDEIKNRNVKFYEVYARGNNILTRILSLIYIGDLTSITIAVIKGIDPIEIEPIRKLKKLVKATGYLSKLMETIEY